MRRCTAFILLFVTICDCGDSPPETLVTGYDEEEIEAATARARSEVEAFIK